MSSTTGMLTAAARTRVHFRQGPASCLGSTGRKPFVSIIIPAHNEEQYLPATLEALGRQTYPLLEIIVVANGCTDNTVAVARGKCHKLFTFQERGLSRARNLGAEKASGSLLIFLDADTLMEPDAVQKIVSQFSRRFSTGTLVGRPDSQRPAHRFIYFWKNLLHICGLHHGSSGVILCWKDHFRAAGGFDEALQLRENSELMVRLKKFGRYHCIRSTIATTSMRRYQKKGTRETVWLWFKVWLLSVFCDVRKRTYESVR